VDEKELIARFKRREPAAVHELVRACGDRLLRSAFLLCGNEADAQDLVQETLLQALQSAHRFYGRSSVYTWLHAILLNLNRHYHRQRKRFVSDDALGDLFSVEDSPQLDGDFTTSTLAGALGRLSAAHREVLVLRFYENMKIHEIAAHLGISRGTVKSRLHYAIAEMQKLLPAELNLFGARGTNNIERK
jgi:RNA polymerase sigma factor (sigma-70 family)